MYIYSIKTIRWNSNPKSEGRQSEEFVVSPGLEEVLEYLKLDRADQGVEIESITRCVPVIRVLQSIPTE